MFRNKPPLYWFDIARACTCEFTGCFFINLLGCGAAISTGGYGYYISPLVNLTTSNSSEPSDSDAEQFFYGEDYHIVVSLAFGLVVMVGVTMFARVSGAHLNPSVTIGSLIFRRNVTVLRGLLYIPCQFLGCLAGSALLLALLPPEHDRRDVFVSVVHKDHGGQLWQAAIWEIILTFMWVLVFLEVVRDPHDYSEATNPLLIGVTIMLIHMTAVYATTGSTNPARALGAAIVSNYYEDIWVFLVFSPIGGILGAVAHFLFFLKF